LIRRQAEEIERLRAEIEISAAESAVRRDRHSQPPE
jgi:hypothetical protein